MGEEATGSEGRKPSDDLVADQLTLEGDAVPHREVIREQERLVREARERELRARREQARRERRQPMDPARMQPLPLDDSLDL
jgi:hypothetical protein